MISIEDIVWQDRLIRIFIDQGRIYRIEDLGPGSPKALHVIPGMIDLHVHSRQPGGDCKEDWEHLYQAAIMGGVTTVVTMPNTAPAITNMETLQVARDLAKNSPLQPRFWFGATADNFEDMQEALRQPDVVGLKMFMGSSTGDLLIDTASRQLAVLQLAAKNRAVVAVHAEDEHIIQTQLKASHKNLCSKRHHLIRPPAAEAEAVNSILHLSKEAGCELYICHVSLASTAKHIVGRQAKGQLVWIEVTPHHLFLDQHSLETDRAPFFQMNPPLRHPNNRERLLKLFLDDKLDTVGSDHAPHTVAEKQSNDYQKIPSGIPGLQTSLPLLVDLVVNGRLSWQRLVDYTSRRPAEIAGFANKGKIEVGADADFVIINPNLPTEITNQSMAYKCGWTPFAGKTTQGRIVATMLAGEFHYDIR